LQSLIVRNGNRVAKENVVQVKKHVLANKFDWVPIRENAYDIGSSKAFEIPQQTIVLTTVAVEEHIETPLTAIPLD